MSVEVYQSNTENVFMTRRACSWQAVVRQATVFYEQVSLASICSNWATVSRASVQQAQVKRATGLKPGELIDIQNVDVYARASYGESFRRVVSTFWADLTTSWYQCGVTIP